MKVVVDLLSAPADSGGMRSYAVEVLTAWKSAHPRDHLIVVGPPWVREFRDGPEVRVVGRGGSVGRILAQLLVTPLLFWRYRADAVVALGPVVTPFVPRRRRVCVVHDWRHKHHPEEFSRQVLLFRRLWVPLIQCSGGVAVISEKTHRETLKYAPRAHPVLIENGRDHPRRWKVAPRPSAAHPSILTFGHRAAKRPELVLRAAGLLAKDSEWRLIILGATGGYADELAGLALSLGISDRVDLPGFVSDNCYRECVAHAHVVVLASTDEGFGLPVVEANYFGAHAIATTDSGVGAIHGGRVTLSPPEPTALAEAITEALAGPRIADGRLEGNTWATTAARLRQLAVCDHRERSPEA